MRLPPAAVLGRWVLWCGVVALLVRLLRAMLG